jgi:hypothetical protein
MAAPNIVNVANLFGETEQYTPTTSESSATSNSSGSGKVYRINSIRVSNVNGSSGASGNITIKHRTDVSGSPSSVHIADEIVVDAQASFEAVSASFYLKEDQDIRLQASANSTFEVLISYEDISD